MTTTTPGMTMAESVEIALAKLTGKVDTLVTQFQDMNARASKGDDALHVKLDAIATEMRNSMAQIAEQNRQAVARAHGRIDGVEKEIAHYKGGAKVVNWVFGVVFAVAFSLIAWVLSRVNSTYDQNIRHDEQIKALVQQVSKEDRAPRQTVATGPGH